jgi:predicted RNA-binding Zn-ribbon protein involved in translation (DUF1610 family)
MPKKKQTEQAKQTEDRELLKLVRYCPDCDADIMPDEDGQIRINFCPDCGTKLIQPTRCVWCNNPANASATYCTGCGMMIKR